MFNWLEDLVWLFIENVIGLNQNDKIANSIHFFIYDVIKIIILLSIMIFIISFIRSYFSASKTRKILNKTSGIMGNVGGALMGIVTPFCSCSSVPIFIGFVEGGVSLGATFSFLITSPIVNEAAFAILLAAFGWKIALIYVLCGVAVGVLGGFVIGKLKMEKHVEEYVYKANMAELEEEKKSLKDRLDFAYENVKDIISRIWIYLLIGIFIGALIHGWAPEDILVRYAGKENPFGVFVAVVFGIPLYSNALGTIPIAEALILKGAGIGTALSFMMATTALSLPEMILLRKVIKPKLIGVFVLITGIGILMVGYLFNYII